MEALRAEKFSFTYPKGKSPATKEVSFSVNSGEFVCICGKTGSGKSTLLRNLKPEIAPHGGKEGKIKICGKTLEELTPLESASRIGFVFQDPDSQTVTDRVWHELAFGLENLGCESGKIRLKVAEMSNFFGIQNRIDKDVKELSGGQKQILNLAAVMIMEPEILIADEPTAQLDPIAASEFITMLKRINAELGTTIIVSEQRLEEVLPIADRVMLIDGGKLEFDGKPGEFAYKLAEENEIAGAVPTATKAYALCVKERSAERWGKEQVPVDVRRGRDWLIGEFPKKPVYTRVEEVTKTEESSAEAETAIKAREIRFRYKKNDPEIFKGLSIQIKAGEILTIHGGNGSGKTTLLSMLAGRRKPTSGKIYVYGSCAMLPQDPRVMFTAESVGKELEGVNLPVELQFLDAEKFSDRHPYDLSCGEQEKLALTKVLMTDPDVLLLDEPTKGLDASSKRELKEVLLKLKKCGKTILVSSHDAAFCAEIADRCAMIFAGEITGMESPRKFFSENSFYTTGASRMSRQVFEDAVTPEDIAVLYKANKNKSQIDDDNLKNSGENSKENTKGRNDKEKAKEGKKRGRRIARQNKMKQNIITMLAFLFMAGTLLLSTTLIEGRGYYITCLLLIIYMLVPFVAGYERRRPPAREIVIVAVLVALGVIGREVFFFIPQFTPVIAVSVIAGISMGANQGFMTGAMIAFVSNFLFGQGPWTPWQMFALGLTGFIAGIIFKNRHRLATVLVYGGAASFLYGGIVDIWTVLAVSAKPTLGTFAAVYGSALFYDLMIAVSTVIFLAVMYVPMTVRLERVKQKYGAFGRVRQM